MAVPQAESSTTSARVPRREAGKEDETHSAQQQTHTLKPQFTQIPPNRLLQNGSSLATRSHFIINGKRKRECVYRRTADGATAILDVVCVCACVCDRFSFHHDRNHILSSFPGLYHPPDAW